MIPASTMLFLVGDDASVSPRPQDNQARFAHPDSAGNGRLAAAVIRNLLAALALVDRAVGRVVGHVHVPIGRSATGEQQG